MKTGDNRKRVVVDDDPNVSATLRGGLENTGWFQVVATCASAEHALKVLTALPATQRPHLVLLDIKMPGMGGVKCCRELWRLFPALLVAMHTAKAVREHFEEARLAGADAYIVKGISMDQLAGALHRLKRREGQCVCIAPSEPVGLFKPPHGLDLLTPCEVRLLELSATGMRDKEMAATLGRSESTIKCQLALVRSKLGVTSTREAIFLCQAGQAGLPKKY